MSKNHDGENWPYHEDVHGDLVACSTNPCRLHGGNDIMADSLADAYKSMYDEVRNENAELKKNIEQEHREWSIPGFEASELCDNLVDYASEMGMRNNHVDSSNLTEGEQVFRLQDGSYVSAKEIEEKFSEEDMHRLIITANGYDRDDELADHWNDRTWLDKHASEALERRARDKEDGTTLGVSVMRMPSPEQWSQETGRPVEEYPALSENDKKHITSYFRRGGASMQKRSEKIHSDMSTESRNLYGEDDGTEDARASHKKANMMAWSAIGQDALLNHSPNSIWQHVDDDGIDHMMVSHGDDTVVHNAAVKSIQASSEDLIPIGFDDPQVIDTDDGVLIINGRSKTDVHISSDKGTRIDWSTHDDKGGTMNGSGSGSITGDGEHITRNDMLKAIRTSLAGTER
jgi:hypothetical protein